MSTVDSPKQDARRYDAGADGTYKNVCESCISRIAWRAASLKDN